MGNSISARFEWADASVKAKDGSAQLQTSVANQDILYEIVNMIEQLCANYPNESKAEFKSPLVWNSKLTPSVFAAHPSAANWVVKEPSKSNTKGSISSSTLRADGQPVFYMEQNEIGYKAKVFTFEQLLKFLEVANEQKLAELQAMVQVSRDPITTIFGVSGEGGKALVESFDAFNNETEPKKKDQYAKLYKLLLVINSFDLQLMAKAVKGIAKGKFLDISRVTEELEMLKAFCGPETEHALVMIDWDLDFTFAGGFKAPPWRQIYGELSYIKVQCHDKDAFIVTASKKGYFVNKGHVMDAAGNANLDYEAASDVYDSLVEVLRHTSAHFAGHIDQQGYIYNRVGHETGLTAVAAESNETAEQQTLETKAERTDEAQHRRVEKDIAKRPKDGKKKPKSSKPNHSAEPSLKWRALALKDEPAKDRKGKSGDKKRSESSKKDGKRRMQRADSFDEDFEASDSDVYSEEDQQE
ncbi:Armadillo repeat-containing protein 4, partial [Kappamyces sp. JEL0680]